MIGGMKIKVEVTKDDIRLGSRKSVAHCPVARAVRRAVKPHKINCGAAGLWEVFLLKRFKDKGRWITRGRNAMNKWVRLPKKVTRFIVAFDMKRPGADPLSFNISVPDEWGK